MLVKKTNVTNIEKPTLRSRSWSRKKKFRDDRGRKNQSKTNCGRFCWNHPLPEGGLARSRLSDIERGHLMPSSDELARLDKP
jgi:hypothetical protein